MLFSIELKQRTQLSNLRRPVSMVSPVEWWRVAHRSNLFMCTITLMRKIPPLLTVLGGCEEVGDIRFQRYSQSASLSPGNLLVPMVHQKHLPRSLNDTRYAVKKWYAGRPTAVRVIWPVTVQPPPPPPNAWGTTPVNAASDTSYGLFFIFHW